MALAHDLAAELTRLIVAVNRAVAPKHGVPLREVAAEHGLDSLELLPPLRDFLSAGSLTREIAFERGMYWDRAHLQSRLRELIESGHVIEGAAGMGATPLLRPVLAAMEAALGDVAAELWGDHADDVDTVVRTARLVIDSLGHDHLVAVAHRALPEPADSYLLLEHRITTLRYARQADHAAAWRSRGLSAPEIVVMTALWRGLDAGDAGPGIAGLIEKDYARDDPLQLTENGRTVREAIESDTNHRSDRTYATLSESEVLEFLAALRRLPGGE